VSAYREPARMPAEPAPYLSPLADCPICGACPAMLYFHDPTCAWFIRYLAAGKQMLQGFGPPHSQSVWSQMTVLEMRAVNALVPQAPLKTPWYTRLWRRSS
jgi:hypothetical protein